MKMDPELGASRITTFLGVDDVSVAAGRSSRLTPLKRRRRDSAEPGALSDNGTQ